jgi:ABC-type multidrug transport system ATPase subunit
MIIRRGRSVIVGTPDELRDRIAGQPVLEVVLKEVNQSIIEAVKRLEQVGGVRFDEAKSSLMITLNDAESATPEVVKGIVGVDGKVLSVNVVRPSLEEVYLKLMKEGEEN